MGYAEYENKLIQDVNTAAEAMKNVIESALNNGYHIRTNIIFSNVVGGLVEYKITILKDNVTIYTKD
jgi:hypothetical protein